MKCFSINLWVLFVIILITFCSYCIISLFTIAADDDYDECDSDLRKVIGINGRRVLRQIPDTRDHRCPHKFSTLAEHNIKVSIIISYHNESLPTLLTTIYSIYRRTPLQYLQEIIIIDDYSENGSTFKSLGELTCPPFNNRTLLRMQRNGQRWGLIKSRNMGALMARGNFLMFMDSHCEVNQQWLETLLHALLSSAGDGRAAVSPMLDNIDVETGEYKTTEAAIKGGFDWNLHFHWIARDNILNPFTTFRSPTFAGGVFLISRNWFFKLKAFNTRLEIWGGEALEFSLKVWLCGGEIRIVPCSRVGHVFRKEHIFKFPNNDGQRIYLRNSKIIAETWLDHYKYNFYNRKPEARNIHLNISHTEIREFKESLKCHKFEWYLNNVFPELRASNNFTAYGTIAISCTTADQCLHHELNDPTIVVAPCFMTNISKWFLMKSSLQLQSDKGLCLTLTSDPGFGLNVALTKCFGQYQQKWLRFGLQLRHLITGLCLEVTVEMHLTANPCRREAPSQNFKFFRELEIL